MLSEEQLAAALKAFGEAVPAGTKLHSLKVTPSVGYADTEAKPVFVFVLADSDKDVQRLSQVIDRGLRRLKPSQAFQPRFCGISLKPLRPLKKKFLKQAPTSFSKTASGRGKRPAPTSPPSRGLWQYQGVRFEPVGNSGTL